MVAGRLGGEYDEYAPFELSQAVKEARTPSRSSNRHNPRFHSKMHLTPERNFIVRNQPAPCDSSICSTSTRDTGRDVPCVGEFLDRFTSLCLGSPPIDASLLQREKRRARRSKSEETRVVYPIAGFPVHLNSEKLVDQRRKSLQQHFFRPVSEDEICPPIRKNTT